MPICPKCGKSDSLCTCFEVDNDNSLSKGEFKFSIDILKVFKYFKKDKKDNK